MLNISLRNVLTKTQWHLLEMTRRLLPILWLMKKMLEREEVVVEVQVVVMSHLTFERVPPQQLEEREWVANTSAMISPHSELQT